MKTKRVHAGIHVHIAVSDEWYLLGNIPPARTFLAAFHVQDGGGSLHIRQVLACSVVCIV